jgi:hypothetical protein
MEGAVRASARQAELRAKFGDVQRSVAGASARNMTFVVETEQPILIGSAKTRAKGRGLSGLRYPLMTQVFFGPGITGYQ